MDICVKKQTSGTPHKQIRFFPLPFFSKYDLENPNKNAE